MPALEHDDVGILAAWLDKLLVHGLDRREVLRDDAFTKILMSSISRSRGSWKMRMPSTMTTLLGRMSSVSSVR